MSIVLESNDSKIYSMTTLCNHCGFHNPPGMRFCGNCGSRLADTSASTTAGSTTAETDLQHLGVLIGADLSERFQEAGLEAAGQRRTVTVLFTDLTGFTALAERMDGEDLYELVQHYFRILINIVYRYEGIVDKLTGDGLMALFGAPIAHENNAERAVMAALDMQREVEGLSRSLTNSTGVQLNMRVGLHSGSVVVGGIGSNMLMDYTAIGDTVNLAHRIEEAAPPGSILISSAVYRQIRAIFECQQVSVLNPKGISRPVLAYRVIGARDLTGPVRGIEGLHAPMIGRDHELGILEESLRFLLEMQEGQFVLISGEAGLGKSRLTAEFKSRLDLQKMRVLEGASLAYRKSVSYYIFKEIFYNYLGVAHNTPPKQVRNQLAHIMESALGPQSPEANIYLEHMLSLPYSDASTGDRLRYLEPSQIRQQIFLAVRDLLTAEAYELPLMLILEDLHWADEASLDLLRFLLDAIPKAPIFILAISRTTDDGALAAAINWAQENLSEHFHHIPLRNLGFDQSEQLLLQLLSIQNLDQELRDQILNRAAGIPFYLEEILRMMIDDGYIQHKGERWEITPSAKLSEMGVPETLQDLILARFDRLDKTQRRVLQIASVIGANFNLPLLNAVLDPPNQEVTAAVLDSLVQRDFVRARGGKYKSEYEFRHILMSDAIYATILRRERRSLHGQVAEAIEQLYAGRTDSQVELLANHYRWSLNLDKALHYLILAGQKSIRNHANEQARIHFQAAIDLLAEVDHRPSQAMQAHLGMGDVLMLFGDYGTAREHYQISLSAAAEQASDLYGKESSVLNRKIAKTFERQGEYDQALAHLADALVDLDSASRSIYANADELRNERAQIWNDIGWIHFRRGNFPDAKQHMARALEWVKDTHSYDVIASILNRLAGVAYTQGDWDLAAEYLRKSIDMRESIHDLTGLASSLGNLGFLEIEMGQFDHAIQHLTRSYELKSRLGQAEGMAAALTNMGWLQIERGNLQEARKQLHQALDLARKIGFSSLIRQISKSLGELHIAAKEWQAATELLTESTPALLEMGANDQLIDSYRLLAEAALGAGQPEAARKWLQKIESLVQEMGREAQGVSAVQMGEIQRVQGMLAIQLQDWESAEQHLRESEEVFTKLNSQFHLGRSTYQRGVLAEACGDCGTAAIKFQEAVQLFRQVGARLDQSRAEEAVLRLSA